MNRLEAFRASFARLVATIGGIRPDSIESIPLVEAFTTVPREQFIGSGPWRIVTQSGYVTVPADDPAFLYQDFAVALQPDQHINNGQPSLHVRCLAALQIKTGEKVVHVGAGTGYYTALLVALVGASGSVIAYEVGKQMADKAAANLKDYSNISVRNRSGVEPPLPECDVIYVNAGATAPMDPWLDALRPGGRLLFPLTTTHGFGAMLLVTRKSENEFAARFIIQAAFVHCLGARDEKTGKKLAEAFKTGGIANYQKQGGMWDVKSLRRKTEPDGTCWFAGNDWWLSSAAA
jgi:protein-L-isoaspartate(D-aspartate) O-methyltransferase